MRISNALIFAPAGLNRPSHPGIIMRLVAALQRWHERSQERQQLLRMTPRELRDLGLTTVDAWREANKPLWRD